MEDRFIVNQRGGAQFVRYEGALNEAHKAGLKEIETELVQPPMEINGMLAIVRATVTIEGKDARPIKCSALGDASPNEPKAKPGTPAHDRPVPLAETRAKARAIKDSVNMQAILHGDTHEEEVSEPSPLSALRGGAVAPPQDEDEEEEKDRIVDECLDIAEQLPDAANVDADVVRASAERSLAYAKAARQRLYIKAEEYGVEVS